MKVVRVLELDVLWAGAAATLVDDQTGGLPVTTPKVRIEVQKSATEWLPIDLEPVITSLGTYVFPKLEKRGDARNQPARTYRIVVDAPGYTPYYRFDSEGVVLDFYPFDDNLETAVPPLRPEIIALYPARDYPFGNVPVIHGEVKLAGAPVRNALVECNSDRVLTNKKGEFTLPMGRSPAAQVLVDASDNAGHTQSIPVTVPQGLGQFYTINF